MPWGLNTCTGSLHRGEKRLVFCDSRQLVEEIGAALRERGVTTFLSHASLPLDERCRAEQAFAEARDCVIVATSTLKLGVDVGDLDRVIQVNAPPTVAAFLQSSCQMVRGYLVRRPIEEPDRGRIESDARAVPRNTASPARHCTTSVAHLAMCSYSESDAYRRLLARISDSSDFMP